MKIRINVLPGEQKEKMKEERKIGFMLKLGFSFIIALLLLNGVLFAMQIALGIEFQAAGRMSEASRSKNSGKENQLERVFQDTGKDVSSFTKIKSDTPGWARVLARFSELCPNEIRIDQISASENHLKVTGFSKTRDAFIGFQDKLKNEGFQFPVNISNLVASDNFNFDLDLTIPQDYLIRK